MEITTANNPNVIHVSYGAFLATRNDAAGDKGVKIVTKDNVPVWVIPNAYWWDKDAIIENMENNKEAILERIEKQTA